jgi:hypothetical protein
MIAECHAWRLKSFLVADASRIGGRAHAVGESAARGAIKSKWVLTDRMNKFACTTARLNRLGRVRTIVAIAEIQTFAKRRAAACLVKAADTG